MAPTLTWQRWNGLIQREMAKETVSFEKLDREHRRERAADTKRLREGKVTPSSLQEENSIVPEHARVRVHDLIGYARRNYLPK